MCEVNWVDYNFRRLLALNSVVVENGILEASELQDRPSLEISLGKKRAQKSVANSIFSVFCVGSVHELGLLVKAALLTSVLLTSPFREPQV